MGFNFGAFAGGISTGVERQLKLGKEIQALKKQNDVRNLIAQGLAEQQTANSLQQAQGAAKVTEGPANEGQAYQSETGATVAPVRTASVESRALPPISAATPGLAPPMGASSDGNAGEAEAQAAYQASKQAQTPAVQATPQAAAPTPQAAAASGVQAGKFYDGDKKFDTRAEAAKSAAGTPMSKDAYLAKNIYPKVRDYYLSQGDVEGAEQWDKYSKTKHGEAVNATWAKVVTAPDLDTAAKHARDLYEYVDDGITTTGQKIVTKSDGTQVAVVTMKDKATGKTSEMELTQEKIMNMAGAANPQQMFKDFQTKQTAAEKLKYEAALKAQERAQKKQDDIELEGVKSKSQRELKVYEQDRLDQREGLKTKGEMDKLGLKYELDAEFEQKYKKSTSPTERRALLVDMLGKNDPRFMRDTPEEKERKIKEVESLIYKDEAKPVAQPGVASKPIGYDPKYKVVYQRGTGKPFHVVDGQYVPIEGAVPPQASGMPKK